MSRGYSPRQEFLPSDAGGLSLVAHDDGFFYDKGTDEEAARLDMMAIMANHVSIHMINLLKGRLGVEHPVVADIGAGDSVRLGNELTARGDDYSAVEMREKAVETLRNAGLVAHHSLATELPFEPETVDVAHSRYTWGWLNGQRTEALAQMIRSGKDRMAITVIDYDWSVISGPEPFMESVGRLKDIMRLSNFEPDYGATLQADFRERLEYLVEGDHKIVMTRTETYEGPMTEGLDRIITPTVLAIVAQLTKEGMFDAKIEELLRDLDEQYLYAAEHPEARVRLPDTVAVGVVIENKSTRLSPVMRTYLDAHDGARDARQVYEGYVEGSDFTRPFPHIQSISDIVIPTSNAMILASRQLQTTSYYKKGLIEFDGLGSRGALHESIDPTELVGRSVYFCALIGDGEETNWMNNVVRVVLPNKEGAKSLPTIQRLIRLDSKMTPTQREEYKFMQDNHTTVEISSLAKNMLRSRSDEVALSMMAAAEYVARSGYQYGVMDLQEVHVSMIERLFGTKAIHRIDIEGAAHTIDLPGVNGDKQYIPLYFEALECVDQVRLYAREQTGRRFRKIEQAAEEIIAARSA